ncbi:MAG: chemotaxis response regulator protein-glutamate methylesterase [Chloroflexi bacterium HGW-Chloroflexi-4]|jgi:two-component system chemotaxis response regulator CheB|nr:MAG: chemotaxis response regulator protein-glutamate methylesterase [Chloroflexi bacterium HGW-Chloroflexi-4]
MNISRNTSMVDASKIIKVMVVDDSAFMRFSITKHLNSTPNIQVIVTARDGREALELLEKFHPDVITLDVEMPRLDGLSTLKEIMAHHPCPVIMLSSLTKEGATETIRALTLGAIDFVAKPENKVNISDVMNEVVAKILKVVNARVVSIPIATQQPKSIVKNDSKIVRPLTNKDKVLIIGSSTGGPRALNTLVPELEDIPAAILIIQHMPVGFTHSLAERLDAASKIRVKEAEPGDQLEVGKALIAPGGFHMVLDNDNKITLNQNPTVHGVRPSIDVTMFSVVQHYGKSVVGVILTGMGMDGTSGSTLIHESGGYIFAEDESSCVVWGMPRSVTEAGVVDKIVPLHEMAPAVMSYLRKSD